MTKKDITAELLGYCKVNPRQIDLFNKSCLKRHKEDLERIYDYTRTHATDEDKYFVYQLIISK